MDKEWIRQECKYWDAVQGTPMPKIDKYKLSQMSTKEKKKFFEDRQKLRVKKFNSEWRAYHDWVLH